MTPKRTCWTITEDIQYQDGDYVKPCTGISGPRNADLSRDDILNHPNKIKFKLVNDDDETDAIGYMVLGSDCDSMEFAPLDDFGMGGLGSTSIFIMENRKWKQV